MSGLLTYGLGGGSLLTFGLGGGGQPPRGDRDRWVFRAIAEALEETGAFGVVLPHELPDRARATSGSGPVAAFKRTSAREVDQSCNPPSRLRTVSYSLAILIRAEDEEGRWEALEWLQEVAREALDGRSLAGITWPFLTVLARDEDDPKARHPEQRVVMRGEFAYEITDYTRDTAE